MALSWIRKKLYVEDPHIWLEDVLGEKSLSWVREQNQSAVSAIGDPEKTDAYKRILAILTSKDKIPSITRIGNGGQFYNFWQDEKHVKGIWRRTTLQSYRTDAPEWHTVLDIDALNAEEGRGAKSEADTEVEWVWHGYSLLDEGPAGPWDRALISLSPAGKDADTMREFDLIAERFIPASDGGFAIPQVSKSSYGYRSRNELLISCAFDEDQMTDSGYPRIVKSWRRGTPFSEAVTVFEGEKGDITVGQQLYHDRGHLHEMQYRYTTFYTTKAWHRKPDLAKTAAEDDSPFRLIPVPDDAETSTFADALTINLRSDWTPADTTYKQGSLLVAPLEDAIAERWSSLITLFEPTASASLEGTTETRSYIVLKVLEDVRTKLRFWRYDGGGVWKETTPSTGGMVPIGEDVALRSVWPDDSDEVWVSRDGFLVPDTLELATAADCCAAPEKLKGRPHQFDAKGLICEQQFADSADGTKIPYFVMRRKDAPMDGSNPTLLDGYGGFEISELPGYSGGVGAGWLERGGIKVIANIRGGGEYGPRWHQAALRENRFKAYEDFEAVAKDLIKRGLTSPAHLACIGGSNGGLLVGNMLTREGANLFGAIVCQVPLLDMKRYHKLLAGASWMAEYGDPDVPSDWAFLQNHSPYQRLQSPSCLGDNGHWRSPCMLFTTSTRDDRVHPGHARKMVKALLDAPLDRGGGSQNILYWENIEGGHGGAADNKQRAYMWALSYNFLMQELVGKKISGRKPSDTALQSAKCNRALFLASLVATVFLAAAASKRKVQ